MKKTLLTLAILCCGSGLFSFFTGRKSGPSEQLAVYYAAQLTELSQRLQALQKATAADSTSGVLRKHFLQSRLAYKKLEPLLAYYFEGDLNKFNGLAVNFIEEEDPAAYQEPQGFQVIETLIYPHYNTHNKTALLQYLQKLQEVTAGLANNPTLLQAGNYVPDALMEELYRIGALGITGFDSPLAAISISETGAALNGIQSITRIYGAEWAALLPGGYRRFVQLLQQAIDYTQGHTQFASFNRMEFFTRFLNPLCELMGRIKTTGHYSENPLHYCLIKKTGSLFSKNALDLSRYMYDDTISAARSALGHRLFYDPLLSINNKRSCAGCHQPEKAFTDGLPKALALDEHGTLPRNTPTLWNAGLQMNLFYDSRHTRLEDVVIEVLNNEKEMNKAASEPVAKLRGTGYPKLFALAYEGDTAITEKKIAHAIAQYLQILVSYNARFDQYMRGRKNSLTHEEIKGFNLFAGKAKCATCHYLPLFNGSKPPLYYYQESEVIGVPANTALPAQPDNDPGRFQTLPLDFLNHAFKTPTLRNIALTAPYMHNGIFKTLDEVIEFYNNGGGNGLGLALPNQTLPAEKLQLSKKEKLQLKAFLLALTDTSGKPTQ